MITNESSSETASEDPAGVLLVPGSTGETYGREPWRSAYETYLRGWVTGRASLEHELALANAAADAWYFRANYSPAEIREMRLRAMDEGWQAYWDAGMPTEVSA